MEKWQLKRDVVWVDTDEEIALFYFLGHRSLIKGSFVGSSLKKVFARLSQPHTIEELDAVLAPTVSRAEIEESVRALNEAGFLARATPGERCIPAVSDALFAGFVDRFYRSSVGRSEALSRLQETRIVMIDAVGGNGAGFTSIFKDALAAAGFNGVETLGQTDFDSAFREELARESSRVIYIVCGSWLMPTAIKKWNRRFLEESRRWLCILEDDFGGSLGPYLGIQDGPCFECLERQRTRNVSDPRTYRDCVRYFERDPGNLPSAFPPFSQSLAGAALVETLKLVISPQLSSLNQGLREFDFLNNRTRYHAVLPSPSCEACCVSPPIKLDCAP